MVAFYFVVFAYRHYLGRSFCSLKDIISRSLINKSTSILIRLDNDLVGR